MPATVFELSRFKALSSVFEQLKDLPQVAFLDSAEQGAQGRFSIVGFDPYCVVEQVDGVCLVDGKPQEAQFLQVLKQLLEQEKEPNETKLPLTGGALGYLGYDMGRELAGVQSRHQAPDRMPQAQMVFYDTLLIEDHESQVLYLCCQGKTRSPQDALAWTEKLVAGCSDAPVPGKHGKQAPFTPNFTQDDYQTALGRMVDYMLDGHIYVANMTQTLAIELKKEPYQAYRYLRAHNPAPFAAYLKGPGFDVCCASMERFLQVRDGVVETRPIKGTRKRGTTLEEDAQLREELAQSPKDNSELLMIVDLERNDLSLSCQVGTVKAHPQFVVEPYPTVFHLVATVEGRLSQDKTAIDLVEGAFPGGSITGAPKIRAMEIIDELEHGQRGLYTGSIGYFANSGDCDLNVVIRTAVCQGGTATLGVGGGITAESDFDFEYEETLQKARAVLEALRSVPE